TLPVGYGDGYLRLFSNKGEVLIRGKAYPVVGNVCMDQTMVDIGPNGEAYCDDDVEMFGSHIKLEEICQKVGTIPYEILCCISNRVPRIYL
ncbi:MAG: alanine racemase, partial [Alphaproteobacteria bacterium]|nr:alanine racemase [Alphaproteobacteria bacterium]